MSHSQAGEGVGGPRSWCELLRMTSRWGGVDFPDGSVAADLIAEGVGAFKGVWGARLGLQHSVASCLAMMTPFRLILTSGPSVPRVLNFTWAGPNARPRTTWFTKLD